MTCVCAHVCERACVRMNARACVCARVRSCPCVCPCVCACASVRVDSIICLKLFVSTRMFRQPDVFLPR